MANLLRVSALILATFVLLTAAGLLLILFALPSTSVLSYAVAHGAQSGTTIGLFASGSVLLIGGVAAAVMLIAEFSSVSRVPRRAMAQRVTATAGGVAFLDVILAALVVPYRTANIAWFDIATITLAAIYFALTKRCGLQSPTA